jgi:hypothetical protein
MSLAGAQKALKGRRYFAYSAPLLGRVAEFVGLAGKACGAIDEKQTTNVQANLVLLPRNVDLDQS